MKNSPLTIKHYPHVGITRASFQDDGRNAQDLIDSLVEKSGVDLDISTYYHDYHINKSFRAKAKVNYDDGDHFDSTIGANLARKRVMDKYHKQIDARLNKFIAELRTVEATVLRYMESHGVKVTAPNTMEIYESKFIPSASEVHNKRK